MTRNNIPEQGRNDVAEQDGSKDRWEFHQEGNGDWRWTRKAPNGETVGVSHEGYRNKADCQANATRNGWPGSLGFHLGNIIEEKKPR